MREEAEGATVTVSLSLNLPPPPPLTFQEVKNKCSLIWFSSAFALNHPAVSREEEGTETDSLIWKDVETNRNPRRGIFLPKICEDGRLKVKKKKGHQEGAQKASGRV